MRTFILLTAALACPPHSLAATLRSAATLEQPQVRVADLFDDAGPAAGRVLGPGPAPGGRIVVEAAQLSAIARQFGVDWRTTSTADRIVIDRPGQLVPREDVVAALRAALQSAGAPPDMEIDLPSFMSPVVSLSAEPHCTIEQLDFDGGTGRFTGTLAIVTSDMPIQRLRLSGQVQAMTDILVPVQRLPAGHVVAAGDLQPSRMRASMLHGDLVSESGQAVGLALGRTAQAGQPLPKSILAPPLLVRRGAQVTMRLQSAGLSLSASGLAMNAGGLGERIGVMNPSSRAIVEAEVLGPDEVRVAPDSTPRMTRTQNTQVTLR